MIKKVMWDKGHGGSDPGAVGNDLQEKTLTHQIVEYALAYMNNNYTGFEQRTTRTGDQTVALNSRDDEADNWGADVFVSVHINSGGGTGFETYIYNSQPSSSTIDLQNILHAEILPAMQRFGNITDRGKKRANFAVLRETNMPSILTENLFIDTPDSTYLKNKEFLKAIGEAHARGVAKFLGLPTKTLPVQVVEENSELKIEDVKPKSPPKQGLGVLKVLDHTVLREKATAYSPVIRNIEPGGEYVVHQYQNGWYDIGGWIYSPHVNFLPNPSIKMGKS
jgi:N-acetylmuramoyl-L-alanine amidase